LKYFWDANICIYLIKGDNSYLIDKISNWSPEDFTLSSIMVAELEYGVGKSQQKERNIFALERFIISFKILSFGSAAEKKYGDIRAHLERQGLLIVGLYYFIVAQALSLNLKIITNNCAEFTRIDGLVVEDWSRGWKKKFLSPDPIKVSRPRDYADSQENTDPIQAREWY